MSTCLEASPAPSIKSAPQASDCIANINEDEEDESKEEDDEEEEDEEEEEEEEEGFGAEVFCGGSLEEERESFRSRERVREICGASDSVDMASFLKDFIDLHSDQKGKRDSAESLVIHEQGMGQGIGQGRSGGRVITKSLLSGCDESSDEEEEVEMDEEDEEDGIDFPTDTGACPEKEYHYVGRDGRVLPLYLEPDMYVQSHTHILSDILVIILPALLRFS